MEEEKVAELQKGSSAIKKEETSSPAISKQEADNVKSDEIQSTTVDMKEDSADDGKSESMTSDIKQAVSTAVSQSPAVEQSTVTDHNNRRVIITGVLKFISQKEIPKLMKKWLANMEDPDSIVISKYKKAPKGTWILATCETEEMAQKLINHFTEHKILNNRGKQISASKADGGSDNKRKRNERDEGPSKRPTGPMTDDEVRDRIIPLWRKSYEEQLNVKFKSMINASIQKIKKQIKAKFRTLATEANRNSNVKKVKLYHWINATAPSVPQVSPIIASPRSHAYRNKCEFTFGYRHKDGDDNDGINNKVPSLGFMARGWSGGVSSPHCLNNIPWEACSIADIVDDFLSTSPLKPYDTLSHTGFWRILTIRLSTRTKECMLVVQHAECDNETLFETEKARLVKSLVDCDLPMPNRPVEVNESHYKLRVTSIFFQVYTGLSTPFPSHPVQHVYGKTFLSEKLGQCTFQVSPGAFFQVNTECAELLYQIVVDKVKEVCPSDSLLFDVCCGTGTIGITCIKEGVVSEVVGVDIAEPAIADANSNKAANGLEEKCRFIAAKAESVMGEEVSKLRGNNDRSVVAVVDPAREGLHADVVRAIRSTQRIQRLVYVSCNPTGSLVQDATLLCAPPTKKFKGRAFRPSFCQPVDMFPSSNHCEMVMVFDRLTAEEEFGPSKGEEAKDAKTEMKTET